MKIIIEELRLKNFKKFREKNFSFSKDVTTIVGDNGEGKTTVFDAICWCLFGKNSAGQTSFSIKTIDEDMKEIPHLDHSVQLSLLVLREEGREERIDLQRTLKEIWVKKRGANEQVLKNNTTEYTINGEATTAKDYEKFISELISEGLFKTITNPHHFTSLNWKIQRDFLSKLAGDIHSDEVAGNDVDLRAFIAKLGEDADVIEFLKHLSYKIKEVKKKIERIPIRLEEHNKALPERLDWDNVDAEEAAESEVMYAISQDILRIKSGNGADVERNRIRKELSEVQDTIDRIEKAERLRLKAICSEQQQRINEVGKKFSSLLGTQRDLETSIQSLDTMMERCRKNADDNFKSEQAYIREHWPETQADFHSSGETVCPVCHQPLPHDMMEKAEEKFNLHKAELKQQLTERAAAAKKMLADAEQQVREYEQKKAEAEKSLADTKQAINETFAEKAKLEKLPVTTADELLKENETYTEMVSKKAELQIKLEEAGMSDDESKQLKELETKYDESSKRLDAIKSKKVFKIMYDKIQGNMDQIREEEQQLLTQLSELEREEDVARRYNSRENTVIEERINRHFSTVRWKMFRTVNNGGEPFDEPYCECYVDGIAYHDGLNYAGKVNAGLDIIDAMCRYYNVSAPIVIDNTESVLSILPTESQQIRLRAEKTQLHINEQGA